MTAPTLTRRGFICLALALMPGVVAAREGRDGNDRDVQRPVELKWVYTAEELGRLDLDTKQRLWRRPVNKYTVIHGFSEWMTKWLIAMAIRNPGRYRRLVKDMSGLKGDRRYSRLVAEINSLDEEIRDLEIRIQRIKDTHGDNRIHNMRVTVLSGEMWELIEFRKGVEAWKRRTKEGTLPPPPAPIQ